VTENGRKPIIGLSGAIGAGKTTVARILGELGCFVFSSDEANREVLNRPAVIEQLSSWWGSDIMDPDGGLNRKALAGRIFADQKARKQLESLTHPLIASQRQASIREAISDPAVKAVVLDSPLLFEAHLDRECDQVIFVDASHAQRLSRVVHGRGWDAAELARRAATQQSPTEKRQRSDFVVVNEGSLESLRSRVTEVLRCILSLSTGA
jgi:dephospho-CoA kinase